MNRGAARQTIFYTANEARRFLSLMGQGHAMHGVEIHAYCLMSNHYHLLLHCPDGGLSSFMQRLGSIYTRSTNEDKGADGPIFRGRFRSLVCDTPEYVDFVSRYIHRNPLDVAPDRPLHEWRWSSYGNYIGQRPRPRWLSTSTVLGWHGGRVGYQQFVESCPSAAGSDVTARWDWAVVTAIAEYERDHGEVPTQQLRRSVTVAAALLMSDASGGALFDHLGLVTTRSRREATRRSASRVAKHPEISFIVGRAIELFR